MRTRPTVLCAALALAASLAAEPVCVGETCYPSREAAIEAGALPPDGGEAAAGETGGNHVPANVAAADKARVAFGYMRPREFLAFLRNERTDDGLGGKSILVVVLLVLLGGLAANLTPCVLPLVPVNVAILLGRAESSRASRIARGFAYGAGMAVSYGALGLAAAFGGMAFGTVQSSPWFNLSVAVVFTALGLGMLGTFNIDPATAWRRLTSGGRARAPGGVRQSRGLGGAFLMGAGAAVLAGACVQPILLATLVYTADGFAAGRLWTVSLPFLLGAGMGLPWIFVAAGISVLPRPGAWMAWVKRAFAVAIFAMAAWYAHLAWQGFRPSGHHADKSSSHIAATPDTWSQAFAEARVTDKPIMVDVWATWCKNCLAMETTTFKDAQVQEALAGFHVIKLQMEDMSKIAEIPELGGLGIKGLPAFVVLEEHGHKQGSGSDGH